ncbi:MAG: hypothetical protein K2Z76_11230, partial [Mycobacterium gordonae]|nr:hypothetical protein [Mycobacterium gordonae]
AGVSRAVPPGVGGRDDLPFGAGATPGDGDDPVDVDGRPAELRRGALGAVWHAVSGVMELVPHVLHTWV